MQSSKGVSLDDLYRDVVLDHCRNPRGREALLEQDVENQGFNPVCGDEVRLALKFDGGRVDRVHVASRGCSISTASGSMLAELLPGMTLDEVERLAETFRGLMHDEPVPPDMDIGDLDALEGVKQFPVRIKCALLAWVTLRDAIKAWRAGENLEATSTTESYGDGDDEEDEERAESEVPS